jgi:hypothetical protein
LSRRRPRGGNPDEQQIADVLIRETVATVKSAYRK